MLKVCTFWEYMSKKFPRGGEGFDCWHLVNFFVKKNCWKNLFVRARVRANARYTCAPENEKIFWKKRKKIFKSHVCKQVCAACMHMTKNIFEKKHFFYKISNHKLMYNEYMHSHELMNKMNSYSVSWCSQRMSESYCSSAKISFVWI